MNYRTWEFVYLGLNPSSVWALGRCTWWPTPRAGTAGRAASATSRPVKSGFLPSAASRPAKSKGTPQASPSSPVVYARLRAGPAPPPGMGEVRAAAGEGDARGRRGGRRRKRGRPNPWRRFALARERRGRCRSMGKNSEPVRINDSRRVIFWNFSQRKPEKVGVRLLWNSY